MDQGSSRDLSHADGAVKGGHTPGPWCRSGMRQKVGGADTHSVVATVDGKEIIIASVWYDPTTHEGFHDARLIASAPDLLDALKACAQWIVDLGESGDAGFWDGEKTLEVIAARAAIAKATGADQ